MRRIKLEIDSSKGLDYRNNGVLIPENANADLSNVEFFQGIVRRSRGLNTFPFAGLYGDLLKIVQFIDTSRISSLLAFTTAGLFEYNSVTQTWNYVTSPTFGEDYFISSATYIDYQIFVSLQNTGKKYDGTTVTDVVGLTDIKSKAVVSFWSHLLLCYTIESGVTCPYRVRWNSIGELEDWTGGDAGFVDLIESSDVVSVAGTILDRCFIYKEKSIWECTYVGSPKIFAFSRILDKIGCIAPETLATINSVHVFLGSDNVYMFDGRSYTAIGDMIQPKLFGVTSQVNKDKLHLSSGVYIPELEEYWLCIPMDDDDLPFEIFKYNFRAQSWWSKTSPYPMKSFAPYLSFENKRWLDLVGTWEEQSWKWNASSMKESFPITLICSEYNNDPIIFIVDYNTVKDYDVYSDTFIITGDFSTGIRTRVTEFWCEAFGGSTLQCLYSIDEGTTWVDLGNNTLTNLWAWYKWTFDVDTTTIRFKLVFGNAEIRLRKSAIIYTERKR